MASVSVRYIVNDVEAAMSFYARHLGFKVEMKPAPGFAMPDGRRPEPGGWNRIQLEVDDLQGLVDSLRKAGVRFRNEIVAGRGGKQILLDDPPVTVSSYFSPMSILAGLDRRRGRAAN